MKNYLHKKLKCILILLLFTSTTYAQYDEVWEKAFPSDSISNNSQGARSIKKDAAGNIYVTGISNYATINNYSVFVMKYDSNGVYQWKTNFYYQSSLTGPYNVFQVDPFGNSYIICVGSNNTYYLFKVDPNGVISWHISQTAYQYTCITLDPNYNIIIGSNNYIMPPGNDWIYNTNHSVITKVANNGVTMWEKFDHQLFYFPYSFYSSNISDIATDNNGNIYTVGNETVGYQNTGYQSWSPQNRKFIMKCDGNGVFLWNQFDPLNGTISADQARRIIVANNLIYVAASNSIYTNNGVSVHSYDLAGNQQWIVSSLVGSFEEMVADGSGNIYVARSFYIAKISSGGTILWNNPVNPINANERLQYSGEHCFALSDGGQLFAATYHAGYHINKYNTSNGQLELAINNPLGYNSQGYSKLLGGSGASFYFFFWNYPSQVITEKYMPCTTATPFVNIEALAGTTICNSDSIKLKAIPVLGGLHPTYNWYKTYYSMGIPYFGYFATGETIKYPASFFTNNDTIQCRMFSSYGCSSFAPNIPAMDSAVVKKVSYCSITVNLNTIIEGYYIGNGLMRAVIDPLNHPLFCDSIVLALADTSVGYEIKYNSKAILNTDGTSTFTFPLGVLGKSYYLVIRHRNSIETWSKYPVLFTSETLSADFVSP